MHSKTFASILAVATVAVTIPAAAAFSGNAEPYNPGLGACGAVSRSTDFVVSLPPSQYAGHCFNQVKVTYQGTAIDVTVVDQCIACSGDSIHLSPAAFQALAPLSAGLIPVTWEFA